MADPLHASITMKIGQDSVNVSGPLPFVRDVFEKFLAAVGLEEVEDVELPSTPLTSEPALW